MPSFTLVPHKVSTRITDPLVSPLAAIGVTPNMISVFGFAGNVSAGALAAGGHFLWAGVVMLIFSALDLLDGALARKTGTVTKFGAVFDSVLDRLSEAAVLAGVLFHYTQLGGQTMEIALCYAAIVGSIMVSTCAPAPRAKASRFARASSPEQSGSSFLAARSLSVTASSSGRSGSSPSSPTSPPSSA